MIITTATTIIIIIIIAIIIIIVIVIITTIIIAIVACMHCISRSADLGAGANTLGAEPANVVLCAEGDKAQHTSQRPDCIGATVEHASMHLLAAQHGVPCWLFLFRQDWQRLQTWHIIHCFLWRRWTRSSLPRDTEALKYINPAFNSTQQVSLPRVLRSVKHPWLHAQCAMTIPSSLPCTTHPTQTSRTDTHAPKDP